MHPLPSPSHRLIPSSSLIVCLLLPVLRELPGDWSWRPCSLASASSGASLSCLAHTLTQTDTPKRTQPLLPRSPPAPRCLRISDCETSSLAPLSALSSSLIYLDIGGNNVRRDLAPLSALTGLISLSLGSSPDCHDLTALSTLTGLRVSGNFDEWPLLPISHSCSCHSYRSHSC